MRYLSLLIVLFNFIISESIEYNDETIFNMIKEKNLKLNFLEETDTDDEKYDKDLSFEEILTKKG